MKVKPVRVCVATTTAKKHICIYVVKKLYVYMYICS